MSDSVLMDTEAPYLHEELCRSGRIRYRVAYKASSVQESPYVILARVTEVPPIIASSVSSTTETSVIHT